MKLENLLAKGKRFLRNSLIYASVPLMIACSSGGSGGGNGNGGGGGDSETHENHMPTEEQVENVYVDGNTWYFSEPIDYNEGDIIGFGLSDNSVVSEKFPYGFLKRVTQVYDETTIEVENGTLEEAVKNAIASNQLKNSDENYLEDINETFDLGQFSATFEGMEFSNLGATLSGGIYFDLSANLETQFGENGIEYFSFEPFVDENSNLEAILVSTIPGVGHEIEFAQYPLSPFTIPIPGLPFPLVILPKLSVNVGLQGDLSPITTSVTNNALFSTRISYDGNWDFNNTFSNFLDVNPPSIPDTLDFTAYISPISEFHFYGIAGPYARANGYLRGIASSSSWQVRAGLSGQLGVNMEMLSKTLLDYSKTFLLYEEVVAFGTTPTQGTLTDSRDGKVYDTVRIGNQWWMAENLNYNSSNSWCYNNDSNNCNIYGRLYDWVAAISNCPTGWHLPTNSEWNTLTDSSLGGNTNNAGGKLKETGFTHWNSPNTGATNESGFTALPGGIRYSNGTYQYINQRGFFWTSTSQSDSTRAYDRVLYSGLSGYGIDFGNDNKNNAMSVRCIKN